MKNVLKVVAVIVLISVSVFFGVVYYKTFLQPVVNADDGKDNSNVQTVLTPTEPKKEEQYPPSPTVYRSEFPKKATTTVDGYVNNIGGYGSEELKEYYYFMNKYFIILSSNSDNCDITDNGSGIVVAIVDNSGTLSSTFSLSSDGRESYLCSNIYDDGILIVTTNGVGTTVYGVTVDGGITKLTLPAKSDKAISCYCSFGTVIATFSSNTIRVYSLTRTLSVSYNVEFNSEGATDPLAIYQSGNFTLLANGEGYGKYITFDLFGNHSSITLAEIEDAVPTEEGYLVATKSNGKIFLIRFSYKGESLGQSELTQGDDVKIGRAPNGFYAVIYGTNKQTTSYFLCKHFDVVSENKSDYSGFTDVGEMVYRNGKMYFRAVNKKDCSLYEYDVNNHTAKSVISVENAYGMKFSFSDGITLLFTSTNTVGDYKGCWGNTDVWIKGIDSI